MSSLYFLRTKLVAGTNKGYFHGFELVDLETLSTQTLLNTHGHQFDFVKKAQCMALYRIGEEFLLCYDSTHAGFYRVHNTDAVVNGR